jgi:hypothetical protein
MSKTYLQQGNEAFRSGDYERAIDFYKKSEQENPSLAFLLKDNLNLAYKKIKDKNNNILKYKKSIAFCIPIMDRADDIKATLKNNLDVIERFEGIVKIYINCFDGNNIIHNWVNEIFAEEKYKKLISFNISPRLAYWHFSWAKNSFQNLITEDYYSSLDGDNFLSLEEVENLLNTVNSEQELVIHGFSGNWGDGTSGRLTVPTRIYRKYGYLNEIYPRQADEIGFLANIIYNENKVKFITYEKANVFELSGVMKKWVNLNKVSINHAELKKPFINSPINPRGSDYLNNSEVFSFYQSFNASYTCLKLSSNRDAQAYFEKQLSASATGINATMAEKVLDKSFTFRKIPNLTDDLTMYAVIKDDNLFLNKWIEHYRLLGVKRFIIVDDKSKVSIDSKIFGNDIYIFNPSIGDFKTCKVLWISLLLKCFQKVDSWFLTADSDEFISLEGVADSLQDYCKVLDKNNQKFSTGLLLDMLPNKNLDIDKINTSRFIEQFSNFYLSSDSSNETYQNTASIQWAFGDHWLYSYKIDARWRFFQTIDSLRKFPILKYNPCMLLNQGYHALTLEGKNVSSNWAFKKTNFVIPVKHYKFVTLFSNTMQEEKFDAYHDRTKQNLQKIVKKDINVFKHEIDTCLSVVEFDFNRFKSIFNIQ